MKMNSIIMMILLMTITTHELMWTETLAYRRLSPVLCLNPWFDLIQWYFEGGTILQTCILSTGRIRSKYRKVIQLANGKIGSPDQVVKFQRLFYQIS